MFAIQSSRISNTFSFIPFGGSFSLSFSVVDSVSSSSPCDDRFIPRHHVTISKSTRKIIFFGHHSQSDSSL